jgi:LysR family transcriptional regulator, glycine cleavage system transcriptional activator
LLSATPARQDRPICAKPSAAMDAIESLGETDTLSVSVAPSFAAKWLLPRLESFERERPEIDVHVSVSMQLADFARDRVDVAIRYGGGGYPEVFFEKLLAETVIPVCSPLRCPRDLLSLTLLHDDSPDNDHSCPNWEMWLRAAGVDNVEVDRGPRFNRASLVIESAIFGRGPAPLDRHTAMDFESNRLRGLFTGAGPMNILFEHIYTD